MAGIQGASCGTEDDVRGASVRRPEAAHRLRPALRDGALFATRFPNVQPCQKIDS